MDGEAEFMGNGSGLVGGKVRLESYFGHAHVVAGADIKCFGASGPGGGGDVDRGRANANAAGLDDYRGDAPTMVLVGAEVQYVGIKVSFRNMGGKSRVGELRGLRVCFSYGLAGLEFVEAAEDVHEARLAKGVKNLRTSTVGSYNPDIAQHGKMSGNG